jgi:hypothetical protein
MIGYLLLAIGLAALAFFAYRAGRIWLDAKQRDFEPASRLGWALLGAILPSRYWWGARIEAMSKGQQAALLARETQATNLEHAGSLHCPLCGAEVPHAWALDASGKPTVADGPVQCPKCDFRLDACRHCTHFMPGAPPAWSGNAWGQGDMTFGRCAVYKKTQPVDQVAGPDIADRLKERGYEQIRGPLPIQDSMLRPDFCRAFEPRRGRIRASKVAWPDDRRTALLRLLQAPSIADRPAPTTPPQDDEQWLL